MRYIVDIVAENRPGVLYRIAGLLTKRKINIERMNVYAVNHEDISKIFLTADIEERIVDTLVKQINKIIEIQHISYHKATH